MRRGTHWHLSTRTRPTVKSLSRCIFVCLACRKPIVQIKRLLKLSTGNIHYFPGDFETSVLLPVSDDDSAVRYVNGCDSRPGCVCWQTETLLCRLKDAHCLILHRLSIFKAGGAKARGKMIYSEMYSNGQQYQLEREKNHLNLFKLMKSHIVLWPR